MRTRDDGLAGRVAVITGGASGIGQALAAAYARAGADSVIGVLPGDPYGADETIALVEAEGGRCVAVEMDVRSTEGNETLAQAAIDEFGRLDVAVAAAGILRRQSLGEMTDEAWDDMLQVDLAGVLRTFRSCAARMTSAGAMVATSSIAGGVYGWEEHSHYAAAKSGLLGLCRSLAVELAPRRIRVNAVIPGLIESPQSLDGRNSLGKEGLEAAGRIIPWGRVGNVDEAARVIRFLTSDDSAYVTGQQIIVDGGLTVRWPS
ncbi:SDR family NAD(P)-dependent oxidoreductase [Leucobacter celer]|uniref:SDR family NAD(P)-dependent oxidoreductase n=1 Tax=Leucobacter celer TaxID=668625 RepID=UPI0006A7C5FE|nr:SDR family oxidoreductase [Leucobacter celer]